MRRHLYTEQEKIDATYYCTHAEMKRKDAATELGISVRTLDKWIPRYKDYRCDKSLHQIKMYFWTKSSKPLVAPEPIISKKKTKKNHRTSSGVMFR